MRIELSLVAWLQMKKEVRGEALHSSEKEAPMDSKR